MSSHKVGYKNPPVNTRFKAGQSGNPKGRPKGGKNFSTLIQEELNNKVNIQESGKARRITKREALIKRLSQKGLDGDLKAAQLIIQMVRDMEEKEEIRDAMRVQQHAGQEDMEILDRFLGACLPKAY